MKALYRLIRYHPLIERGQYLVRRNPSLKVPSVNLQLTVNAGEIIVDCGANIGDVTSKFARTGATVYAFEPNPLCFAILQKRFSAMKSVHCFNQGVMDRRCHLKLSTPKAHGQWDALESTVSASFVPQEMRFDASMIQEVEVECIDFNEFIRSLNGRVKLLKMDIEGSEISVLNHLIDRNTIELIDLVIVETHEKQIPRLLRSTEELRNRIRKDGLEKKIRLDWY